MKLRMPEPLDSIGIPAFQHDKRKPLKPSSLRTGVLRLRPKSALGAGVGRSNRPAPTNGNNSLRLSRRGRLLTVANCVTSFSGHILIEPSRTNQLVVWLETQHG